MWGGLIPQLGKKNLRPQFLVEDFINATSELPYECTSCGATILSDSISIQDITCENHAIIETGKYEILAMLS